MQVPVVLVPVEGSTEPCIIEYPDFARIMAAGFSDRFYLRYNRKADGKAYVATSHPLDQMVYSVSRLVMDAPARTNVCFRTQDRHNLMRSNLRLAGGWSKGHERAALSAGTGEL